LIGFPADGKMGLPNEPQVGPGPRAVRVVSGACESDVLPQTAAAAATVTVDSHRAARKNNAPVGGGE